MDESNKRDYLCHSLEMLAEYLRENEDIPLPFPYMSMDCDSKEEFVAAAKILSRISNDGLKKSEDEWDYKMEGHIGNIWIVLKCSHRNICERVKTGTRTVTRQVPVNPDVEMTTIEEEEDVYEWQCPDSILALAKKQEPANA